MIRLSLLGVLLCAILSSPATAGEVGPKGSEGASAAKNTPFVGCADSSPVGQGSKGIDTRLPCLEPEVTVTLGNKPSPSGPLAPLPKIEFDLPDGLIPPPANPLALPIPTPAADAQPTVAKKLTPDEIARKIAPNFDVSRDYVRLTQCYGMADLMGAVTRIQASKPSATPQIVGVARTIGAMQEAMQPMVLAASTVRGEARFRRDYDAIARRGQVELATSKTPNATMTRRLATLDACRGDIARWRGGR